MKSQYMYSTMGRMPAAAAPMPRPVKPASEMGVSRTRSGPKTSSRPRVTPNTPPPPHTAMSSPMMKTVGSRSISSRRASFSACT